MKPTHGNCDHYMQEGQPCSGWQCLQAEHDALRSAVQDALRLLESLPVALVFQRSGGTRGVKQTIAALREALAAASIISPEITGPKAEADPELSAALGWPGGISNPVLDRTQLLQMVAVLRVAQQPALEPVAWMPASVEHRFRDALELIAAPRRPDGSWNRDREACRQLAVEALGNEKC